MFLNQERRGRGLPSTSHSIRRESVTFTVWLVRLRLYRGASRAAGERERERERGISTPRLVCTDVNSSISSLRTVNVHDIRQKVS